MVPTTDVHREPCLLEWVRLSESLTDAQCDDIIALSASYQEWRGQLGNRDVSDYRKAMVRRWAFDDVSRPFYEMLYGIVMRANEQHFWFELSNILAPDYITYQGGFGHFGWHNDYIYMASDKVRKLTLVIQLSDAESYAGGELELYISRPQALPAERGAILSRSGTFSSSLIFNG